MDEISAFNQSKWNELVQRGVLHSRPLLDLTPETARSRLDPYSMLGEVAGKEVLCLASAGGQQSAAFAVLGAHVHVLDLTPAMLERDRQVSDHYGVPIDIQQGDMRDLSRYDENAFDLVWHPYSINFIPGAKPVFDEVARVLRPGGRYYFQLHNPFFMGMDEREWNGQSYPLHQPYENGLEVQEPTWTFDDEQGNLVEMAGPRAFRHTLGEVLNYLIGKGFLLLGLWEEPTLDTDEEPSPGSWDHMLRIAPPWLSMWFAYHPKVVEELKKAG